MNHNNYQNGKAQLGGTHMSVVASNLLIVLKAHSTGGKSSLVLEI